MIFENIITQKHNFLIAITKALYKYTLSILIKFIDKICAHQKTNEVFFYSISASRSLKDKRLKLWTI